MKDEDRLRGLYSCWQFKSGSLNFRTVPIFHVIILFIIYKLNADSELGAFWIDLASSKRKTKLIQLQNCTICTFLLNSGKTDVLEEHSNSKIPKFETIPLQKYASGVQIYKMAANNLSRQKLIGDFRIQNVRKLKDFLSKKCPEFGKLPKFKECKLLQTVVSIENWWYMFQQEVKCPKKQKKAHWIFFLKCEICIEKVHQFKSNYFILTSIFMEKRLILKVKMIIMLWRPSVGALFCILRYLKDGFFFIPCSLEWARNYEKSVVQVPLGSYLFKTAQEKVYM